MGSYMRCARRMDGRSLGNLLLLEELVVLLKLCDKAGCCLNINSGPLGGLLIIDRVRFTATSLPPR